MGLVSSVRLGEGDGHMRSLGFKYNGKPLSVLRRDFKKLYLADKGQIY